MKSLKALKRRRVLASQLNRRAKWRDRVRQEIEQSQKEGITHSGVDLSGIYIEVSSDEVHQNMQRLVHSSAFLVKAKPPVKRGKGIRVKTYSTGKSAVRPTGKSG